MADTMIRTSTRTVKGALRAVDLERNTCQIFTAKGKFVNCTYDESLEPEIKAALDLEVEASGEVIGAEANGSARKATWLHIEEISAEEEEFDFEAAGLEPMSPKEILASDAIGMWKDRKDMEDVDEYMRRLRGG